MEGTDNLEVINNVTEVDEKIIELPPKVQRFIHLYMTGQYTLVKLSQMLEVHPNTLSKWLKRSDVQAIISDMQITTHQVVGIKLKAMSTMATDKLEQLINSPIDGVALQAVKDILDRSGHKPKQEIKVDKTVITFEEKLSKLMDETLDDDIIILDEEDYYEEQ